MEKADIKDRLKEAMELNNITQSELAKKANIDKGQLSSYLSGKYKPRQNNIEALAKALGVSEAWLMGYNVSLKNADYIINENVLIESSSSTLKSKQLQKRMATYINILKQLSDANSKKVINYAENLLENQRMEEDLLTNAAHERTDIKATAEMSKNDDDIMDDDNF